MDEEYYFDDREYNNVAFDSYESFDINQEEFNPDDFECDYWETETEDVLIERLEEDAYEAVGFMDEYETEHMFDEVELDDYYYYLES